MTTDAPDLRRRTEMSHGKSAVVIGASMAGLLAARVLAGFYERVTILERDPLPEENEARKGVPQGRHAHVLLVGGADAIEALFPRFFEELQNAGAILADFSTRDVFWYHHGVLKLPASTPIVMYCMTRPFREQHVRQRLLALPNVAIRSCCAVSHLLSDKGRTRITGVSTGHVNGGTPAEALEADLVVDATGRGSHAPQWLEELGYTLPPESSVGIQIGYSSRFYERPRESHPVWKVLAVYAKAPVTRRFGFVFSVEGDRWLVTLAGNLQDYPPADENGFCAFARSLDHPELYQAIRKAKPLTPIVTHRFPSSLWHHYEKLARFPEGFLVTGDAICSFNPIYGQGMSVSALDALALQQCLQKQVPGNASGLWRKFFRVTSRIVKNPWMLATGADFLYPQTAGERPLGAPLLGWYTHRLYHSSGRDREVATRFYQVMHFLKQPATLFDPRLLLRVLRTGDSILT